LSSFSYTLLIIIARKLSEEYPCVGREEVD
jgi:hypothetical protein